MPNNQDTALLSSLMISPNLWLLNSSKHEKYLKPTSKKNLEFRTKSQELNPSNSRSLSQPPAHNLIKLKNKTTARLFENRKKETRQELEIQRSKNYTPRLMLSSWIILNQKRLNNKSSNLK